MRRRLRAAAGAVTRRKRPVTLLPEHRLEHFDGHRVIVDDQDRRDIGHSHRLSVARGSGLRIYQGREAKCISYRSANCSWV